MQIPDDYSRTLEKLLIGVTPEQAKQVGGNGLAIVCAASLLALVSGIEPSALASFAQAMGGIGLSVFANVIYQKCQIFLSQPDSDEKDRLVGLAQTLEKEIKRDAKLRGEIGKFLNEYNAQHIAEEVVKGNPSLTNFQGRTGSKKVKGVVKNLKVCHDSGQTKQDQREKGAIMAGHQV